jgi:hypothetical protein
MSQEIPKTSELEPKLSNIMYDIKECDKRITESMKPGMYKLADKIYNDNCYQNYPGYNAKNYGSLSSKIDTESELKTLGVYLSKDGDNQYNPTKNCDDCEKCDSGIPCACSHCKDKLNYTKDDCAVQLIPEWTRNNRACNDLSAIDYNRYDFIDPNKVNQIQNNDYIGDNTRIQMKNITTKFRTEITGKKTEKTEKTELNKACNCDKLHGVHARLECIYECK